MGIYVYQIVNPGQGAKGHAPARSSGMYSQDEDPPGEFHVKIENINGMKNV